METICKMLAVPAQQASALAADHGLLDASIASAKNYSDIYRYWHAIEYLLKKHRPDSPIAGFLSVGTAVSAAMPEIPAARLLTPAQTAELNNVVSAVQPDDLAPYYDAGELDHAAVYPSTWVEWEETFDPLGQVLEHYSFLMFFAKRCAERGDALLLHFTENDF